MTKRLFWFVLGLASGVAATRYAEARLQRMRERYTPPAIASRVGDAVKRFGSDVAESARAGRQTMQHQEIRMRQTQRRRHREPAVSA